MKKVININRSRLVFPKYDFVIEPDEIKEVTEEQFDGIIRNISIEEILHKSLKKEKKTIVLIIKKVEKSKNIKY